MTEQTTKRITIEPPSGSTILAARHLDATEGRVQVGSTVDTATRSAITHVLNYIAKAHDSPAAPTTSTGPLAARLPLVQGRCPACGTKGLFLGDGGYITCSLIDCPQPDAASEVIADFWDARQHGTFTFCAQNVGHVTMTEFAKKITEKVTAVAHRAEAVQYANEQKQRAERAEAALARVRTLMGYWDKRTDQLKRGAELLHAALDQDAKD